MIAGVDGVAMFQGQGGDMRVGGQVAAGAGLRQEVAQDRPVGGAERGDGGRGLVQPLLHVGTGVLHRQWVLENPPGGGQAQECQQDDPGQTHALAARQDAQAKRGLPDAEADPSLRHRAAD